MNDKSRYEVYVSMNALRENARGRTKENIAAVRHVYLDLDDGGRETLDKLLERSDLPKPNYVLHSSPEKYQVVWKVEGFTQEQAEILQRGLARETGADLAATDSSRVLRLPHFWNHKYGQPVLVQVEKLSEQKHRPDQFPQFPAAERFQPSSVVGNQSASLRNRRPPRRITQSERDWAYAKRALARGDGKEAVIAAIASHRRFDKPDPRYYAELTVDKASRSLENENLVAHIDSAQPQR